MEHLEAYTVEFITIALAHLVAVASPGPDFAIVMKHSIQYGRRIALVTSIGVGTAILLHVVYALAGLGLIINSTPWLYDALIVIASAFLLYIGFSACRSPKPAATQGGTESSKSFNANLSDKKAFIIGFMTNGLNPKATLFFLSLFTVVVSESTPFMVKTGYGVYLALATMAWFCFLSMMLTKQSVRQFFGRNGYLFDRIMGAALILLAINIIVSELF
jgi:threonine/homoserine/homoserine lactone efflux protein